jgi:hypothetical protein
VARHWTEDAIRRELESFLPAFDAWPPYPWFRATGRRGLWQAIAKRGGPERFAAEYGLAYRPYAWGITEAEVRARLRAALRGSNLAAWPPRAWLRQRAGADLVAAVDRFGGPGRWARELGLPLRHRQAHRWTPETIEIALANLVAGRQTWPSRREFAEAGLEGLYHAITRTDGHAAMAACYGLPLQRPRRRRAAPRRTQAGWASAASLAGTSRERGRAPASA